MYADGPDPGNRELLKLLAVAPQSYDQILDALQEPPDQLNAHLLQLELRGVIKRNIGGQYWNLCIGN